MFPKMNESLLDYLDNLVRMGMADAEQVKARDDLLLQKRMDERLPPVFETIQTKQCKR